MRKASLDIKIMRPGGTVVFKRLGGPGQVPQNLVDRVSARLLANSVNQPRSKNYVDLLLSCPISSKLIKSSKSYHHPRLHNWVELVKSAIKAEVPDWEILATLSSFFSEMEANKTGDAVAKRVATFFNLNPVARQKQNHKFLWCCSQTGGFTQIHLSFQIRSKPFKFVMPVHDLNSGLPRMNFYSSCLEYSQLLQDSSL